MVSNFITQALAEKPIFIYGDGSQTRSFCYVDDLVDGIVRMMNQDHFIGPVNLGNPIEKTVKDLSELVIKMSGSRSQVSIKSCHKTTRYKESRIFLWLGKVRMDS